MSVKGRAIAAVRWTSLATAGRVLLQTLQIFALARLLSQHDFGLMAMVLSVTAFVQLFADLGVSSVIIHSRQISDDALSSLYWLNVAVGAVMTVLIALLSPSLAAFLGDPRAALPLALAGCSFLFLALGQQIKVLAEKRLEFRTIAIVELSSAALSTLVAIVAAWHGAGVYSLVAALLIVSGGNSLLYWIFARTDWRLRLHFRWADARPYLSSGMYLLGTSLANTASVQIDILIVGRLLGSTMLGIYSVPRELCLKVMMATNPIITRVGTPLLAEVQHDKARIRRVYLTTLAMTSAINFPIYAFIAAFRHDVALLALGPRWTGAADLLGMFALWGMFRSIGNPIGSLLYGTGRSKLALVQALSVTVTLAIAVVIAAGWGTMGVAIGMTLFYLCFALAVWAGVVRPLTDAGFVEYNRQWLMPLVASAAAAAVATAVAMPVSDSFVRIIVGGIAGGLVYLSVSWIINRTWLRSMLALVGRRRGEAA